MSAGGKPADSSPGQALGLQHLLDTLHLQVNLLTNTQCQVSAGGLPRLILVKLLRTQLDAGEAEAISLAAETNADLILLDEKEARETAKEMGLQVLGTLGILIEAKKTSVINCLREELDNLKAKANFRVSESLYKEALSEVGELS